MPSSPPSRPLVSAAAVVALAVVAASAGCEDTLTGPRVTSATIEPDRIPKQDRGMFDQYFRIEMQVSGFETEFEDVEFFIQTDSGEQPNPPLQLDGYPEFEPGSIVVDGIPQNWFSDIRETGVYPIGTEITSQQNQVRQRSITEVEVFDSTDGG